jgi:quinol monooxygenase YgiN/GNAT superfamily N-acetyltransferase
LTELFIFARFHAQQGRADDVASALRDVLAPTRSESGCLDIKIHHATLDPLLFYIHSRWVDEAAFERHAGLPHTARFIERVQKLIDHPLEVTRTRQILEIRDAQPDDAPAACQVLRRSITELCIADHHNNPEILQRWLANKTPEIIASWIANPANTMLVAVEADAILAVGLVRGLGEIEVNYVSPDARFRGVSRALMGALEFRARAQGATRCTLVSTETARKFYQSLGYQETGAPFGKFGTTGSYPMTKDLA